MDRLSRRNKTEQAVALDALAEIIVEESRSSSPFSYHGVVVVSKHHTKLVESICYV